MKSDDSKRISERSHPTDSSVSPLGSDLSPSLQIRGSSFMCCIIKYHILCMILSASCALTVARDSAQKTNKQTKNPLFRARAASAKRNVTDNVSREKPQKWPPCLAQRKSVTPERRIGGFGTKPSN